MMELRIAGSDWRTLNDLLGPIEACAVLFAEPARSTGGRELLVVRRAVLAEPDDYSFRHAVGAELSPQFVARVSKEAKLAKQALIFVHTHPGEGAPQFSMTDDRGEQLLASFLSVRGQTESHVAMVLSCSGVRARRLGQDEEVAVTSVGDQLVRRFVPLGARSAPPELRHDRQVRAFGTDGQRALANLRVAIVGLGGTGSIAAQQLAHLGVRDFLLIDPDTVDETNLNRVVGARHDDVGIPKTEVAARQVREIDPACVVETLRMNVVLEKVARRLIDADVIVGCTDSHGSRSVLQQVAYQYFIHLIDIGSTIVVESGAVRSIFGRVQLLGPDHPCLWCSALLDSEQVRRDLMSEVERQADPYIQGAHLPAPSVVSLNGVVVSLAVTMLLGLVTAAPVSGHHLLYNALTPSLRSVRGTLQSDCFICSPRGALARGDSLRLYARMEETDAG